MRKRIRQQLPLVHRHMDHEHARELRKISDILDAVPVISDLAFTDLVRGLRDPDAGRLGMTAEQVVRALLVKQMNGFSYDELEFHLADSLAYRAFCRLGIGDEPPALSTLQRNIKKLTPETLEAVNLLIIREADARRIERGAKVRFDCTVTGTNIHDPSDSALLYDGVRVLCRLMLEAKEAFGIPASDHTRRAKRRALGILNAKNEQRRKKLYRDLLGVSRRTVSAAKTSLSSLRRVPGALLVAAGIIAEIEHFVPLIEKVIAQTERRILAGEQVPPQDKIVSIFEPHTDIIVKDRRDVLFGHKLCLAAGASGLVTDLVVLQGNPADSELAVGMVRRQLEIYGRAPRKTAMDGGFASKANLSAIKALGVEDVAFSKKRGLEVAAMARSSWVYRKLRDFRAGVEGVISFLKRCFGLGRCNWRSFDSFKAYAWSSVIAANLLVMARHMLS